MCAGRWQQGRFLRNEAWSGFVHGSSSMYLFPQTVGSINVTGYINTANNTLVITSEPTRAFIFGGALRIQVEGAPEVVEGAVVVQQPLENLLQRFYPRGETYETALDAAHPLQGVGADALRERIEGGMRGLESYTRQQAVEFAWPALS